MSSRPLNILLIDDDPDDVELTRQMLRRGRVPFELRSAPHGEAALALLRREPPHEDAARPDLILLDLNMPVMDGREFLTVVKDDHLLKAIPVVILTTSNAAEEIANSYGLGANGYVSKPLGLDGFGQLEQVVEDYWFKTRRVFDGLD